MRKVTYLGSPVDLGEHKRVVKGDELIFTEMEWQCVFEDTRFRFKEFCEPESENVKFGVTPVETPIFDLRKVNWKSHRLDRVLHLIPIQKLNLVAKAMASLGLPVKYGHRVEGRAVEDSIYKHAVIEGWAINPREEVFPLQSSTRRKKAVETVAN